MENMQAIKNKFIAVRSWCLQNGKLQLEKTVTYPSCCKTQLNYSRTPFLSYNKIFWLSCLPF